MRKDRVHQIEDDMGSIDGRCKCALGINHKTGRLQWCPGCSCFKVLVVVAVVMLPVIIVFVLLTRLDNIGSTPAQPSHLYADDNSIDDDSLGARDSRCIAVRFGLSESTDNEEKDILKDIRTSFIPPEPIYIPPNCGQDNINSRNADDGYYLEYFSRQRRSSSKRNITELDEKGMREMSEETKENTPPVEAIEFKEELPSVEYQKELGDSVESSQLSGFHTFWKGEGSRESIRSTQAQIMKKYMDPTVDPCVDFYQYACGNWANLNPIPKDKAGYDTFEMLRESLDSVLRDLLIEKEDVKNTENALGITPSVHSVDFKTDLKNTLETVRLKKNIIRHRDILDSILAEYQMSRLMRRRRRGLFGKRNHFKGTNAETKAKHLYASCMNSELIEKRGVQPLLDLLVTLGRWPVIDSKWNENTFDWLELVAKLRQYNNDILIVEWVGPDIKNSDENIIQFDQTSLGLPTRDYFLHESNTVYLEAYITFMEKVMVALGAEREVASQTAREVADFEVELAKITSSSEDRANISLLYTRLTLKQLKTQIEQIDWVRYLSIVQKRNVKESETVVIYAIGYMNQLVQLMNKTKSKTLCNYILWRFVRHRINNLDDRFQDAKQEFFQVLFGREQSPPRWKNCIGQVNSNMGMALGAMFVRKYFDENSKEDTLQMTLQIQEAFRQILNTTSWLDDSTKHLAELKVNSMSLKIGYPDFILSHKELNEKYDGLTIDPEKYFENTLNVLRHVSQTEQSKLTETVNKTLWQTAPAIVNAYYSRNKNQIMFPAGILQPPFYHRYFPRSLNYGGIGVVIGHELTHGFDDKGRLFDRDGNIHKWWSDYAINGFHERARCLISQYSNYTVPEVGVAIDGESTQGENIADNGGIRQAFHAYKKWLEKNSSPETLENERLPGVNLNHFQLFFLNFAQVWCGAMRPEAMKNKLKTAVHSPGKFRVIGTLSNSDDFAKVYKCGGGTPMNPVHKCSVW